MPAHPAHRTPHPHAGAGRDRSSKPLEAVARRVRERIPGIRQALDEALHPGDGTSLLDLLHGDHRVFVEWSRARGFGITSRSDVGLGEGADEVVQSAEEVTQRVLDLLLSGTHTSPPAPTDLAGLRQRLGFTQVELAKRMKVQQAAISKLERRKDALLSTLTAYLRAMGGGCYVVVQTRLGKFTLRSIGAPSKGRVRKGAGGRKGAP